MGFVKGSVFTSDASIYRKLFRYRYIELYLLISRLNIDIFRYCHGKYFILEDRFYSLIIS